MQLDGKHIPLPRQQRTGGDFDCAVELRIHDVRRRERGAARRAPGHVEAGDLRAVQIEDRAVIDDVIEQQAVGRGGAAGVREGAAEVGRDRVRGERGLGQLRRSFRVPVHAQRGGTDARIRPQEIHGVRPGIEWTRDGERADERIETGGGEPFRGAVKDDIHQRVVDADGEFHIRQRGVEAGEIKRRAVGALAVDLRVGAVRARADPERLAVEPEPRGMPGHDDRGIARGDIGPVQIVRAVAGRHAERVDAGIEKRRHRLAERLRRTRRRQALLEELHLAQPGEVIVPAMAGVDDEPHLPHARGGEVEVFARLRRDAVGLAEIQRRDRRECTARRGRGLHDDLIRAACHQAGVRLVVIPHLESREVHHRAQVVGDLRRERIVARRECAVREPHRAVGRRAVLAVHQPRAVHRARGEARVARAEFRRKPRHRRAGDIGLHDHRGGDFIAECVVVPRRAGGVREVERHRARAGREVAVFHEQPVATVREVLIHEIAGACIRRRDAHLPRGRPAEAHAVKGGDVSLPRREPRHRDAGGRAGIRRAVEELLA